MTDERMKAQWFRWHHGTADEAKLRTAAKRSGARMCEAVAMWAICMEAASASEPRGSCASLDFEVIDCTQDFEEGTAARLFAAFQKLTRPLVGPNGELLAWTKRQPKRERDEKAASTERVRRFREAQKQAALQDETGNGTPCNATQRPATPRGEERRVEENQELSPSAVAFTPNPPQAAAIVGAFEGHDRGSAKGSRGESIAAPHAIALRQRGLSMTSMNPNLIAFAKDGGTVEHLLEVAEIHGQRGAGYVLTVARRELAEKAAEVRTVEATPITAAQRRPGQTLTALALLQEDKTWTG